MIVDVKQLENMVLSSLTNAEEMLKVLETERGTERETSRSSGCDGSGSGGGWGGGAGLLTVRIYLRACVRLVCVFCVFDRSIYLSVYLCVYMFIY